MEKAHGWTYIRSKNNGKNIDKGSIIASNGLPNPDMATPKDDYDMETHHPAMYRNQINFPEYPRSSEMDMHPGNNLHLDYSPISDLQSSTHSSPYMSHSLAGQEDSTDQFENSQNTGANFKLFDQDDLYSANVQLPTGLPQPMCSDDKIPAPNPAENAVPNESPSDQVYDSVLGYWTAGFHDLKHSGFLKLNRIMGRFRILILLSLTSFIATLSILTSCYNDVKYGKLGIEQLLMPTQSSLPQSSVMPITDSSVGAAQFVIGTEFSTANSILGTPSPMLEVQVLDSTVLYWLRMPW
jgi:hypothetical protein